jgi:hypothetical protein
MGHLLASTEVKVLEPYAVEVAIGPLHGSAQGVARDRRAGSGRVGIELAHIALTHHLHRYLDTRQCRRLFIRILYNAGISNTLLVGGRYE